VKQRQKGGVVKYRSVRYIFYVVVKFINLRFIIRIKLVLYPLSKYQAIMKLVKKLHRSKKIGIYCPRRNRIV
jgi:hypothetical protein